MPDSQYKITAKWTDARVVAGMQKIEAQIKRNTAALREQMRLSAQMGRIVAQSPRQSQQGFQQQVQASRQTTNQLQQQHGAARRLLETNARLYQAGREMRYVWREQTDSLRQYTNEAMKLSQAQSKFKALGLDPEANELAFPGCEKNSRRDQRTHPNRRHRNVA